MRTIGILLLLLVALQGCGRKGALFMPPSSGSAQSTPDQSGQKKP